MSTGEIPAAIRGEMPEQARLGLEKEGNVKILVDKPDRIRYSPRFICDGPTLRG
jgi:hypothetical protein